VIFASAVLLPKCIIELGGERQFAKEIAEGSFIEHDFLPRRHGAAENFNFSESP
jgi:hypothetical protein